jgi:hypothetical protein
MGRPDPGWEWEFLEDHPNATENQVSAAWEAALAADPLLAELSPRWDDGCDSAAPYYYSDGEAEPPAEWEANVPPEPPESQEDESPEAVRALLQAQNDQRERERDAERKPLLGATPAAWEAHISKTVEPPMSLGSGPKRHEVDRHRPRLGDLDRAHDDPRVRGEMGMLRDEFAGSFVIEPDPEHGRRRGTGRKVQRSSAALIRNAEGDVIAHRQIGNDTAAIERVLTRDRPLAAWTPATAPGRPDATARALREELAPRVRELVEQGATRKAIAAVLDCSQGVVRTLLS